MTIKADYADVCWEPINLTTGQGHWHDEDRWPHYETRAKCAEAIAELHRDHDPDDGPLLLVARPCFDRPCVVVVCDECGEQFDYEGDGGMHFDPADPMPVPITDCDWSIEQRRGGPDRHYCPDCPGHWCESCGELHHPGSVCDPDAQPVPITDGQEELGLEVTDA